MFFLDNAAKPPQIFAASTFNRNNFQVISAPWKSKLETCESSIKVCADILNYAFVLVEWLLNMNIASCKLSKIEKTGSPNPKNQPTSFSVFLEFSSYKYFISKC